MNLGEAIKQIRLKAELTQGQVCNKAGIAQGYYSIIESDKNKPSFEVLEKICQAMGVPVFFLLWKATNKKDIRGGSQRALYDSIANQMDIYFDHLKK